MADIAEPKTSRIIYKDINTLFGVDPSPLILENVAAINNQLFNLFSTTPGERPFEPTFGSDVPGLLFDPIDEITAWRIETAMFSAVGHWMSSRIRLDIGRSRVVPNVNAEAFDAKIYYIILVSEINVQLNFQLQA